MKLKGTSAPVTRSTHYDSHGWVDHIVEKVGSTVRYSFSSPVFSQLGEIRTATETRRTNTGPVRFNYDSTNWTRRLLSSYDGVAGNGSGGEFTQWTYDRFGNRLTELHSLPNTTPDPMQYYTVGSDNRLLAVSDHIDSTKSRRYLTDQAGQRLATLDHGTGVMGLWGVSTWTAAGQLYYSMTPESAIGPYDLVWNWYDGSGRRFMTHLATTSDRGGLARPDSTVGFRTYYVYDGNDVAFTLVRPSTRTTWRIQQRYVNTGLDENVAARLWLNGTPTSLALVTDRQGGYIMGVKKDGTEETSTGFYLRNAFGKMESGSTAASSLETHTGLGFAGAGTPTSAGGGYVYLRNRWYDPQTGRFLSQDPIGLAGGVNLYAYAGNNPASFSDPFGLNPDSIEVRWHEVAKGKFHTSIRISPDDQARWAKDPRFRRVSDGRVSLTLSAALEFTRFRGEVACWDLTRPRR